MAFTKFLYNLIGWKNKSESLDTPLGATNLKKMDSAIKTIGDNLNTAYDELSEGKLDKVTAQGMLKDVTYDENTGLFTFTKLDGSEFKVDINIEKIPVSFSMSEDGVITMKTEDETEFTADVSKLIRSYNFNISDTIAFTWMQKADGSGYDVTANIRKGSITNEYLESDYLASIKTQASNAEISAQNASDYADAAAYDAKLAQSYAIGGSGIRAGEDYTNSKYYAEMSSKSATQSSESASESANAATVASGKAAEAEIYKNNAKDYMNEATEYATNASKSATSASSSASTANTKASEASASAKTATEKSESASASASNAEISAQNASESETQAQYYYEQAKSISESFAGALRPMGTVIFANLPTLSNAVEGDMYNVSDQFTTTSSFKEGSGNVVPAGSNVYKTSDGYWDVLAGSPVTGVKGNAESFYREGNVNITPANIGLGNVDNTADADKEVKSAKTLSEVLPVELGGTNATTEKEAQFNLLKDANEVTSLVDESIITGFYVSPTKVTGALYKCTILNLWNYIKAKIKVVLGLTADEYSGNSATSTKLYITQLVNKNIDELLTAGLEYWAGANNGCTGDIPSGTVAFNLKVFKNAGSYLFQRLINQSGIIFTRSYMNSTWTDWSEIATVDELSNYLPLSGGELSGNLTQKRTDAKTVVHILENANRATSVQISDSGLVGMYDHTNSKWLFKSGLHGDTYFLGNADIATKAEQDGEGNVISDTYTKKGWSLIADNTDSTSITFDSSKYSELLIIWHTSPGVRIFGGIYPLAYTGTMGTSIYFSSTSSAMPNISVSGNTITVSRSGIINSVTIYAR